MAQEKVVYGLLGLGAGLGASAVVHRDTIAELRKINAKLDVPLSSVSESIKTELSNVKNQLEKIITRFDVPLSVLQEMVRKAIREELKVITIYVDNGLDQPVTVQIKANREASLAKSVNVGSAFTVPAGSTDARTLTPDTSGWLPYVTVTLVCSSAPSSGSVTVYRIRSKDDQVKIVDALEIRDTNTHDASTDPDKILVVEW